MKKRISALAAGAAIVLMATGCANGGGGGTGTSTENDDVSAAADAALAELATTIIGSGPNGETAVGIEATELSEDEVAEVKDAGLTAALVMHYGGNDWSTAIIDGVQSEFERLGVEVVATTDANFKPEQQVADLETVLALDPDIIVSIPTDPVATAGAYQKVADAGVKLVFLGNVPEGFEQGTDYVSVVAADDKGNGVASAHLMAKALGGEGTIALVFHDVEFFVTNERYRGFKETIESDYPDIEIVEEQGIVGPDFASDAQAAANALLTKYPNLDGIWGVWDVPAEGIMAAARAAGRLDLKIATEDLGTNVAIALAKDELIIGLGAQTPYDQGVASARLGAAASIGKEDLPAYVALNALPVEHENVLEAWETVYRAAPPAELADAFKE